MNSRTSKIIKGIPGFVTDLKDLFLIRNYGMLYQYGWWESRKKKEAINAEGKPMPWYTYPAIEFIEKRLNSTFRVFEYGCGNSTLWWALQSKEVVSCEHNSEWYKSTLAKAPGNVELIHMPLEYGGDYSKVISDYKNQFDIVIIDGRDRVNCAYNTLGALRSSGIIIWDNTEREKYQAGYDYLIKSGFKRIDFWGIGPIGITKWCTSIFYRHGNCLDI